MASKHTITTDGYHGGIAFFDGPNKVAVMNTHHDQGVAIRGVGQLDKMPRESWSIHFTSPSFGLDLLEAVVEAAKKIT